MHEPSTARLAAIRSRAVAVYLVMGDQSKYIQQKNHGIQTAPCVRVCVPTADVREEPRVLLVHETATKRYVREF